METSDNTEVFTDFSQSLDSGFSPQQNKQKARQWQRMVP